MLSLLSNPDFHEREPSVETPSTQLESHTKSEYSELPGWVLLPILTLKVVALILLFQSGFGLIGLGLCAMSMSFLIGEREELRRIREAAITQEIDAVGDEPASRSEARTLLPEAT